MKLSLSHVMLGLVCVLAYLLLVFGGQLGFSRGAAHMAPLMVIVRNRALGNGLVSKFIPRRRRSDDDPFDEAVEGGKDRLGFHYGYTRTCTAVFLLLFPQPPARQPPGMAWLMLSCVFIPARAAVADGRQEEVADDAELASSTASRKAIDSLLDGYVDRHSDRTSCAAPGHYVLGVYGCPAQFGMF